MLKTEPVAAWVVYQKNVAGKVNVGNAICSQREWDAMVLASPGLHVLLQGGIRSEGEAERLARGTSGDTLRPQERKRLREVSIASM